MREPADLHTHTHFSDGALSPDELLSRTKQAGIQILSVTDHDTINGVAECIAAGTKLGISVLTGIELSVSFNQRELHLLGYCFDPTDKDLLKTLTLLYDHRIQRAEKMVSKLNALNVPLRMDVVLEQAGKGIVCRPHIASAMIKSNYASSYSEVFQRYIGDWGPAYEKKPEFPLEKAVSVIRQAGGATFLAHPGSTISAKELSGIIKAGIDGIETVHPCHTGEMQKNYKGIVHQNVMLECGGSDFHGGLRGDDKNLGTYGISMNAIEQLHKRLQKPLP